MAKTVLVTEDDSFLRETIQAVLEEHGVTVLSAENGDEAIQIIDRQPVDLLLLDIFMPVKDGYAVLEHRRTKGLTFPVVILSNASDHISKQKCEELGANDFLVKSDMDEDELWGKIAAFIGE
ncbi:MAG TPA: response regulator [Candidatus Peribacteraceae bacterium]|nr:response regulator [Candidatus Peribacteraceae bacterium]